MSNYRVRQALLASWGWPVDECKLLIALGTYLRDDTLTVIKATDRELMTECGFPRTSLQRARKALVKRGALSYIPGCGRGHSGTYTVCCLPGEAQRAPASGALSEGDVKGTAQAEPFRGERAPNGLIKGSGPAQLPAETKTRSNPASTTTAPPRAVVVPLRAPHEIPHPPSGGGNGLPRSREEIIDRWVDGEISTEEKQAALKALEMP